MNPRQFFTELKRRNVSKVAVAYAVVAWLLIQIATQVFPFFEIPNWGVRLVVVLLILGLPAALVLAWVFEITPEGIKLESTVAPGRSIRRQTSRRIIAITVVLAVVAAAMLIVQVLRPKPAMTSARDRESAKADIPEKSIAVLPFENLSSDKANAYFAAGVQDEILTRLSKIADLKVISRTSTQNYKSAPRNLPEIARQLGVAHILEGSVQKQGDRVRINVQLIKAATDSHLWAEVFNRKLDDIFAVEGDVARAIADQLRAQLSGREEHLIVSKPTENPDAYDAYLRGLAYTLRTQNTPENYLGAQRYFQEAIKLDRKFALAWALLAYVDARGYHTTNLQPTAALREQARESAETALRLEPELGEAWLAKGYYLYGCAGEFEAAIEAYDKAREFLPNSSRIPESLATLARDQGQWERSESYFGEAERLDPRNVSLLTRHAQFYITLRRYRDALRKLDLILEIVPNDIDALVEKAAVAQSEGDLPRAAALLASVHPAAGDPTGWEQVAYQAILERRPTQIINRLQELLANPDPDIGYLDGELRFWLGWAQEVAGDREAARHTWLTARAELEAFLKEQPDNWSILNDLALVVAGLGDKAEAVTLVERARALHPVEKDAANGMQTLDTHARVMTHLGQLDEAITILERILAAPGNGALATGMPLTPALLRLDPMFDPLRKEPRFQQLVAPRP